MKRQKRVAEDAPVETLPDEDVLALCDLHMRRSDQAELSVLLEIQNEGMLTAAAQTQRLDSLMKIYRRGMLRKAEALKVAVERGLRPPLDPNEFL